MESFDYTLSDFVAITKAQLHHNDTPEGRISELLIDSRQFTSAQQTVFFALVSRRNDGHKYISELYGKGLRFFIISRYEEELADCPRAFFLQVPDTLHALQQVAAFHRRRFQIPVIGITGSNGKTIVKEWLFQLMNQEHKIVRSPKSYNSQVGVPLSVWQIKPTDELGIFEAGISEPEEMNLLQPIMLPTIGLFTNIGQAHAANFINKEQKIAEKLKLFLHVDTLIYCTDHLEIQQRIISTEAFKSTRLFTWGRKKGSSLWVQSVNRHVKWTDIEAIYNEEPLFIRVPFTDDAAIENAIHCWAVMLLMGYTHDVIYSGMQRLAPVAMRMELKEGINNCTIINDSYSSDINSLTIALDFLNQQKQHKHKTIILSDILQSGRNENDLYARIADLLYTKEVDRLIGIGPSIGRHAGKFRMEKSFFPSTEEFLKKFPFSGFQNESILIKGARLFGFEEIGKALQQKAHETVLEINLNALIYNLNLIRSRLKPGVKTMVMVKAFSYGSGSYEIAGLLQFHQVDYLAVAYVDEGVELRKAGITLPILVMNPDEESIDSLVKYQLEPEVYSFRILDYLEESRKRIFTGPSVPIRVHLKLDTGMNRLGFREEDITGLVRRFREMEGLQLMSVFSHMAAANLPVHDDFSRGQIRRFQTMCKQLREGLTGGFLMHILNSAGICRFPDAQFDMVRIGISLYGVAACDAYQNQLQQVSSLRTIVSQVKSVGQGESVGYNRSWVAARDSRIATIPIGYADGLSRMLGNEQGRLLVGGELRPVIGEVCMDMCMIDVTGLDVKEGDPVTVFGKDNPVDLLAERSNTISYEVLTNISRRVKRVYFQE